MTNQGSQPLKYRIITFYNNSPSIYLSVCPHVCMKSIYWFVENEEPVDKQSRARGVSCPKGNVTMMTLCWKIAFWFQEHIISFFQSPCVVRYVMVIIPTKIIPQRPHPHSRHTFHLCFILFSSVNSHFDVWWKGVTCRYLCCSNFPSSLIYNTYDFRTMGPVVSPA